jgi:hypothetical protein
MESGTFTGSTYAARQAKEKENVFKKIRLLLLTTTKG